MSSNPEELDLAGIAGKTVSELAVIWDEIGTPHAERQALVQQLCEDVAAIYSNLLKQQEGSRDSLKDQLVSLTESVCTMSTELGEPALPVDDDSLALLQRVERLQSQCDELRVRREERHSKIVELHEKLHSIWNELDLPSARRDADFLVLDESNMTLDRVRAYEIRIVEAEETKKERAQSIEELTERVKALFETLCEQPSQSSALETSVADSAVGERLGFGERVVEQLEAKAQALETRQREREEQVKQYATQITALWERLGVSQEEREAFFEQHQGLGPDVIAACAAELKRLQDMKEERLKELIVECRHRILALWDELGFGNDQRHAFEPYFANVFSEESLDEHEEEEKALEHRRSELKPILDLIKQREDLKEEKMKADIESADPERLLSRKNYDPGRLLREERFRKKYAKRMPLIEERLIQLLTRWENTHADEGPFMYQGSGYLDEILDDQARREAHSRARGNSRSALAPASTNPKTSTASAPRKSSALSAKPRLALKR